jgi:hypothetical protein
LPAMVIFALPLIAAAPGATGACQPCITSGENGRTSVSLFREPHSSIGAFHSTELEGEGYSDQEVSVPLILRLRYAQAERHVILVSYECKPL